jgi:hypothetical protein
MNSKRSLLEKNADKVSDEDDDDKAVHVRSLSKGRLCGGGGHGLEKTRQVSLTRGEANEGFRRQKGKATIFRSSFRLQRQR